MAEKTLARRRGVKSSLEALKIGESLVFTGEPGEPINSLMKLIAAPFRGNMSAQGLTQRGGLTVFEGETSRPSVMVTRISEPKE